MQFRFKVLAIADNLNGDGHYTFVSELRGVHGLSGEAYQTEGEEKA